MAAIKSAVTLPIAEPVIRRRLVDSLVLTLVLAVEASWLCGIVATVVWLVVR